MSKTVQKMRSECTDLRGFSLIELLVVIAVIAILAAVIYPVFAGAREKGRQSTFISNFARINSAFARYQLDHNGQAPSVLFAYSGSGNGTMTGGMTGAGPSVPLGLFPAYISDYSIFEDPDNKVTDPNATTGALPVNTVDPGTGTLTASSATFFAADAMDVSPQIVNGTLGPTYVPRYQAAWTSEETNSSPTLPAGVSLNQYQHQLSNASSPGDTYLTATTYHVKSWNKVLVLFKSGTAKTWDTSTFLVSGPDVASIAANGSGVSAANFWLDAPTGEKLQ